MPIYEYRCASCSQEFEVIQKVGSRPLRKCEHCNGKLEKLISRTSFQLKGGGWFAADYSKKSSSEPKKSDASSDAGASKDSKE